MRALLYEFSSSLEDFSIDTSIAVYTPASMTTALWIVVIQQLWLSFKEKLSYNRQQEYIHCRSKYSAVRHKPYSGKVMKVSSGPSTRAAASIASRPTVIVTPTTKGRKDRSKSKSNKSPPTSRSSYWVRTADHFARLTPDSDFFHHTFCTVHTVHSVCSHLILPSLSVLMLHYCS